jgi:hypothetical protein
MNPYQPSQRIPTTNPPSVSTNTDWPPWIEHSVAASGLEKQKMFDPKQHQEPVPPYPEDYNPFRTPRDYGFSQQYEPSNFPDTTHFPTKQSFPSMPGYQSQQHYTAPAPPYISRLPQPIAIPQIMHGRGKSFLRAWPPYLQAFNISQTDFLMFIDNLNVVSTANPPLQILDLAGGFIGMVPYHWAQIAGTAVQATSKLGIAIVSKSRTDIYLKEANEKIFNPKGLKLSIASMDAMRATLRIPETQPILTPLTPEMIQMRTVHRNLLAVRPYNAELELDVPKSAEQTTMLAKLSAKQVEREVEENQKRALKEREKAASKDADREDKKERRAKKKEHEEEKRRQKRERKHRKEDKDSESDTEDGANGGDSDNGKHSRKDKRKEKKDKEEENAKKVLWIVVENLNLETGSNYIYH